MTNYYIYYHYKNIVLRVRSFLMQGIQRFMVLVVMFFDFFLNDFFGFVVAIYDLVHDVEAIHGLCKLQTASGNNF